MIIFKKAGDFDESLTYRIPESLAGQIQEGCFVEVPFRNRNPIGIVVGLEDAPPATFDPAKIREILGVFSSSGLLPRHLAIARFVAQYYRTSLGRSLRLFLPKALWDGKVQPPSRIFIRLKATPPPAVRGKKAQRILEILTTAGGPLPIEGLKEQAGGFGADVLRRLIELSAIEEIAEPVHTPFDPVTTVQSEPSISLTADQKSALQGIRDADRPVLLYGVTGSGKTEIYRHLILETVRQGKQAILLVPEIALTPQTIDTFRQSLGDSIALFHSKLSEGERLQNWWKVRSGAATLAIGSRSAIFAPVQNLGLVILDEEHEWTYKQESAPYYRTHRIAEEMAKLWGSKLVFGSATPSAETYHKAKVGDYETASLSERIHQTEMPQIHLVDLREEFKKRNFSVLSLILQNKIRERLERKEQVILFVNQRGLANAVVCRDCGLTEKCPRCDIALKYHKCYQRSAVSGQQNSNSLMAYGRSLSADQLVCHYCQFTKAPELFCPNCKSANIRYMGVGTQKVEEEVRKLFPQARVVRADKDTTDNKEGFEPIYRDFVDQKFDILIGTQMVAKGLDFGPVTLIGIILADIGLHQPDFRSSERLYQILTQVSGRAGRREQRGEVVLQTYNPTHPTIRMASEQKYSEFIDLELKNRSAFGYPPFNRMIKFTVVGADSGALAKHIETERQTLEDIATVNHLSLKIASAPASIPKISDLYHYHVLIRAERPEVLLDHWKIPKGWRIDVDPVHTT